MYNHELTLVGYRIDKDEIGNEIKNPVKTIVLCKTRSIGHSEFYNAKVSDLKPEIKFIIHKFEYSGEKEVIFGDINYKVMRTYESGSFKTNYMNDNVLGYDEIELTCEKVVGSAQES